MIYVASCKQCHSQNIIPHSTQKEPPKTVDTLQFYCTNCGMAYKLDELMGLYIAL
jgi:hypothetical protein